MITHLYLANLLTSGTKEEKDFCLGILSKKQIATLETFWKKRELEKLLELNPDVRIFLDSGAYSLMTQSRKDSDILDKKDFVRRYLDDYIVFIHKYNNQLSGYVNLDIIYDAKGSWENQQYLEQRSLKPIPVYHRGEDIKWLYFYLDRYEYVGIGGLVAGAVNSTQLTIYVMDKVFEYIEKHGLKTKIHGFGITSFTLLRRYPWYSVDSTTWLKFAAYGSVIVPAYNFLKKDYDYSLRPLIVRVSDISMVKSCVHGGNYRHVFSPKIVERIERYFQMIGANSELLKTNNLERKKVNIHYYEHILKDEDFQELRKSKRKSFF